MQILNVGLGRPEHAERYCGKLAPSLMCFAATDNQPYNAFGLQRANMVEMLKTGIGLARASINAMRAGYSQGESTGDVQMMPGTFIIDGAGIIHYAYYSQYAGDDPDIGQLLEATRRLELSPRT